MSKLHSLILHRGLISLLALSLVSCSSSSPTGSPQATQFGGAVAVQWFDLGYTLAQQQALTPPVASRFFGYSGVTLYEAVLPGMPGYQTLVGQLNGLSSLPQSQAQVNSLAKTVDVAELYHWPTVANSALASYFRFNFASSSATVLNAINQMEESINVQFVDSASAETLEASVQRGRLVAADIFTWALSDGYAQYNNCAYTPPIGAGLWVPTAPGFAAALQPCWGEMRPFVLNDGSMCSAVAPPVYNETPGSQFHNEMMEVYNTVQNITTEQMDIAVFWADNPEQTGTPPGHSIKITSQVLELEDASLALAAEAYAKVGIAVADAFISCWWTKYEYSLLRPITCIRDLVDPMWLSPVGTPPFPEYTSGHSVQSGAAAEVLTALFGDNYAFTDHTHDSRGLTPRAFNSFYEAADEAAISRLYGGIHYRAAIDLGVDQGVCIGQQVNSLIFRVPA